MENLIFRGRPNENNECDQWSRVWDSNDQQEYVVQEHVKLAAFLSGKPYLRLIRRMTVAEFLCTDQPPAVKRKLQTILEEQNAPKS